MGFRVSPGYRLRRPRMATFSNGSNLRRIASFSNGFNRGGHGGLRGRGVRAVNQITEAIIGDAIAVHRELGPGLLESCYEECLALLLLRRGLKVERQIALPVHFRGVRLDAAYRVDLLVERTILVELKAVSKLDAVHIAQLNTYLKFSGCKAGLLINFNVTRLVDGLRRVVRDYDGPSPTSQSSAPSAIDSVIAPGSAT